MSTEHCHQGHRERLRERFMENGLDGFADHEVLELLLGYSIARKDTNPLAHELIERYGNLQKALDAPMEELMNIPDMGEYSAFFVKLITDICRRYYEQRNNKAGDTYNEDTFARYLIPRFIGRGEECLYAFYFDATKRMIKCEVLFNGTVNAVEIHVPTLVRKALKLEAAFVVLAHNHFLDATPSLQDMKATTCAYRALEQNNIALLDHYIVCGNEVSSMRKTGHFEKAIGLR